MNLKNSYTAPKQVVGVTDPKYGKELMAWIIAEDRVTLSSEEIRAYCKGELLHHKIPAISSLLNYIQ